MTDRRDAILARLDALLSAVADANGWNYYRDKEDVPPELQPAVNLFDGGEARQPTGDDDGSIATFGYGLVRMSPRIGLYANDAPENVGPILNAMRIAVLKPVFADASIEDAGSLGALLYQPGLFTYEAASTELDRLAQIVGEMLITLAFVYPLNPSEF